MIPELKAAFEAEMAAARRQWRARRPRRAMVHLERAHVLGQYHVGAHVLTHCWMLRLALAHGRYRAALGQAVRIVLGALGSALGRVPEGNTGGSEVSMFARMPVDERLARLLERDHAAAGRRARRPSLRPPQG